MKCTSSFVVCVGVGQCCNRLCVNSAGKHVESFYLLCCVFVLVCAQQVGVSLPKNLKALLCLSNGLDMVWSVLEGVGDSRGTPAPLGRMHLHGLEAMQPLPLDDKNVDRSGIGNTAVQRSHSPRALGAGAHTVEVPCDDEGMLPIGCYCVIPLDHCDGDGVVALVYMGNDTSQVCLCDVFVCISLSSHKLCCVPGLVLHSIWRLVFRGCVF